MLSDAGVTKLDYLMSTHYHVDHIGGLQELSKKIPIANYIDHGPNTEPKEQVQNFSTTYEQFRGTAKHIVAKPGDRVPITGLDWRIVSVGRSGAEDGRCPAAASRIRPARASRRSRTRRRRTTTRPRWAASSPTGSSG